MLTTVAGIGGGITLIAILSAFLDPKEIVGLTAPVLAIGNVSRAAMFPDATDRAAVRWTLPGVVPTALAGSLALPALPGRTIQLAMGLFLVAFVVHQLVRRARGGTLVRDDPVDVRLGLPVGVVLGGLSATVGGAGPICAPYLHARGLTRGAYAATNAWINGASHVIKTTVFVLTGVLTMTNLPASAAAAVTVTMGNRAGKAVLGRISERAFVRVLMATIGLAGVRLLVAGGS